MMREDEAAEPYQKSIVEPIRQALAHARGRKAEAAKILGISRSTLWRRMKSLSG
jgi:transcriptional regulator of acetoin/glycerol metabolism